MNYDKLFYATWGFVFILAGICAIFGMYFQLNLFATIMLWLISIGILLILVGGMTLKETSKTGIIQMFLGLILVVVSASILSVILQLINIFISLAIIIILIGIIIVALSFSKVGEING